MKATPQTFALEGLTPAHRPTRKPLSFFVAGLPAGQPRVKAMARGRFVHIYTPDTVKGPGGQRQPHPGATWKMIVRHETEKAWHEADYPNQWTGPIRVDLTFYFPRPKAHYNTKGFLKPSAPRWHESKPDRDNADKLVLDALTNLCLWRDDAQVCDGRIQKLYETENRGTGCLVEISEATA